MFAVHMCVFMNEGVSQSRRGNAFRMKESLLLCWK